MRRRELLRIPKEERYGVIYKVMERTGPAIIADYAVALTGEEIEGEFPEEYRDVALKLKDLYPSMETGDDIIRHSSQVERIVKGGGG